MMGVNTAWPGGRLGRTPFAQGSEEKTELLCTVGAQGDGATTT